jgi:predicted acylesterase/phospholipase RssA
MPQLRIALTISGAVALGAYEGGALAALLTAVKKLGERMPEEVTVDAIAGASAGSMTALLAAKALLTDADPVDLMYQAWVETPTLSRMKGRGWSGAPLSLVKIRESARDLLGDSYPRGGGSPQQTPVEVQMVLGVLRGLNYEFRRLDASPIDATTYMDWYSRKFNADDGPDAYLAALEPALASGANALAFPPELLNRDADRREYEMNGVRNFPSTGDLWYTDGGTVDNQPLGRALEMTDQLDESFEGRRLHLLIIPDPGFPVPAADSTWADPRHQPSWMPTLARAGKMAMAQTLYDDLRRAEKTNSRLKWSGELVKTLTAHLDSNAGPGLARLIEELEYDRRKELGASSKNPPVPPNPSDPVEQLLKRAMAAATGLQGKHPTAIDAISPLILGAETRNALKQLLSGDRFGHFYGFLDRQLRSRDFALGYRCMLEWLEDSTRGLQRYQINDDYVREAVEVVSSRYEDHWLKRSGFTLGGLPLGSWTEASRVSVRALRLTAVGLLTWSARRRRRALKVVAMRLKGKPASAIASVGRRWKRRRRGG